MPETPSAYAEASGCRMGLTVRYDEIATLTEGEISLKNGEAEYSFRYSEENTNFISETDIPAGNYDLYINGRNAYCGIAADGVSENYEVSLISYCYDAGGAESGSLPISGILYVAPQSQITVEENTGNLEKIGYIFNGFGLSGTAQPVSTVSSERSFVLYALWSIEDPQAAMSSPTETYVYGDSVSITVSHPLLTNGSAEVSCEWYENGESAINDGCSYMPTHIGTVAVGCVVTVKSGDKYASKRFDEVYSFEARTLKISWRTIGGEEYAAPYTYNGTEQSVIPAVGNKARDYDDVNIAADAGGRIDAGEYTLNLRIIGNNADLYKFGEGEDIFRYSIKKANLTDNTQNLNEIYNGQTFSLDFSLSGFAGTENFRSLDESGGCSVSYGEDGENFSDDAPEWKNVGSYKIFYRIDFTNYQTVEGSRSADITPMDINIGINSVDSIYGCELTPLSFTVKSVINDETEDLKIALAKEEGSDAGNYAITGQCGNPNYRAAFSNGTYTIRQRIISVKIEDIQSVYGEELSEPTWHILSGDPLEGDDLNIVLKKAAGDTVGAYEITGSWNNENYLLDFSDGVYTVTQSFVTLKISDVSVFYGQSEAELSYTVESGKIVSEDDIMLTLRREPGYSAGSYAITGESGNPNYCVTVINGIYKIQPAEITVLINDNSSVYGEPIKNLTYEITEGSVLSGDVLDINIGMACDGSAGTYAIDGTDSDNADYHINFIRGEYVIFPIRLSVKIHDAESVYGEGLKDFTYEIISGSPKGNDDLRIVIDKEPGLGAGIYEMKGSCLNKNYSVAFTDGLYTIEKATLTDATANEYTAVYDGTLKTVCFDINGFAYSDTVADCTELYSYTGENDFTTEKAGVRNVADSGRIVFYRLESADYYELSGSVVINVEKRRLTIRIDNKSSKENADFAALTYTVVSGAAADGDDLGVVMSKDGGSSVGRYVISGSVGNGNYEAEIINGEYTVTAADIKAEIKANGISTEAVLTCGEGFAPGVFFEITDCADSIENLPSDYYLLSAVTVRCENADGTANGYDGEITVKIPMPKNFDSGSIKILRISKDGSLSEISSAEEDGFFVFEAETDVEYAFVQISDGKEILKILISLTAFILGLTAFVMAIYVKKNR